MDDHQRRVLGRMIERLDLYESGVIDLGTLPDDLRGLLAASELHDEHLVHGFWDHFREIDMVLELRAEQWASPESDASDVRLREGLDELRAWVSGVLADADDRRT